MADPVAVVASVAVTVMGPVNGAVNVPVIATVAGQAAAGWPMARVADAGTPPRLNAKVWVASESVAEIVTSTAVPNGLVSAAGAVTVMILAAACAGVAETASAEPNSRTQALTRRIWIRFVIVDLCINAPVVPSVTRGAVCDINLYTVGRV